MPWDAERLILIGKGAAWYAVAILFGIELIFLVPFLVLQGGGTLGSFAVWVAAAIIAVAVWSWLLRIANRPFDQARQAAPIDTPITADLEEPTA